MIEAESVRWETLIIKGNYILVIILLDLFHKLIWPLTVLLTRQYSKSFGLHFLEVCLILNAFDILLLGFSIIW